MTTFLVFLYFGIIFFLIWLCFFRIKISNRMTTILLLLLFISTITMSYFYLPKVGNDLYRYFERVYLFNVHAFNNINVYNEELGAKILLYMVSIMQNVHLLPMISNVVCYGIGLYIILNYAKQQKCPSYTIAIAVLIMLSFNNFMTVTSGIRNTMALSFVSLGIYLDIFKNKKVLPYILYLLSISIHVVSGIAVTVIIIYKVFHKTKINMIVILWGFFIDLIFKLLDLLKFNYGYIKLYDYFNESWEGNIVLLIINIVFVIAIAITCKKITATLNKNQIVEKKYIDFLVTYCFLIIGSIFISFTFVGRLCFLLGYILIPFFDIVETKLQNKALLYITSFLFVMIHCFYVITYFVNNVSFSI